MRIRVSVKKLTAASLAIIFIVFFHVLNNVYVDDGDTVAWCKGITPFILVLLCSSLLIIHIMAPPNRLIIYLVTVLYFIFHFSHIILQGFEYDFGTNTRNNVFFRQTEVNVINATHIEISACLGLVLGIILFFLFYNEKPMPKEQSYIEHNVESLSIILIIVGFIADLISSGQAIMALFLGGYANVQDTISGAFYGIKIFSYLLLPGVLIYIQDRNKSNARRRNILILFIFYKVIMMFSGLRAYGLINIMIVTYVYFRNEKIQKIRFRHVILAILALQIGGGLIVGIREARTTGMDIGTIVSYMFDFRSNILFNMLSEFGITQNVVCEVLKGMNGAGNCGRQLLYSLLIVIPGISKIAPNLDYSSAFLEDSLQIHNYGGSYVADILFDFGENGVLIGCIILGIFFTALYEWYERNIQENNRLYVAIASPIIVDFIFCVRSSMAKMPRMIVWYLSVVLFLGVITKTKSRKVK